MVTFELGKYIFGNILAKPGLKFCTFCTFWVKVMLFVVGGFCAGGFLVGDNASVFSKN